LDSAPRSSRHVPLKKIEAVEVGVFLLFILPSMIFSSTIPKSSGLSFPVVAGSTILTDTPLLCLVLYFVWRNGEPFRAIGFFFRNPLKEAAIGIALFLPLLIVMGLIERILRASGLSLPKTAPPYLIPEGSGQVILAIFLLVVVAVSEEVIFRGYLIHRFSRLFESRVTALLLSSALFALGHGYEKSGGVAGVGILGLIFGAVYLWRKSLVAPMVMHFVQDFTGIILAPLGLFS